MHLMALDIISFEALDAFDVTKRREPLHISEICPGQTLVMQVASMYV
jgi:hypothetical protein